MSALLPAATLGEVLSGRASLVGSRLDPSRVRGFVSPVEARVHLGIEYEPSSVVEARALDARSTLSDARVLLSALATRPLASRGERVRRPWIISAHVDNVSIDEALDRIVAPPAGPNARMVHFVHPHALNLAVDDRALAKHLADADLVLPDGVGIRVAARVLGVAMQHNVNGTDLLPVLCDRAATAGIPLVLVGGAPEVAAQCANALKTSHPRLQIPMSSHGFLDAPASSAVRAQIEQLGRCIVLVGMGSPRQEAWAWRWLRHCASATVLTVGGLFDFYAGRIPRAPVALRELGLEWTWRLWQEPSRMARRYLVGNPLFVARSVRQALQSNHAHR